jgi:PAS domain S-box-containing protein
LSEFLALPKAARRLILATVAAGALAVAFRTPDIGQWTRWDLISCLALILASAISEQITIPVHHRTETENFSLTDAIWVPALVFARPSVLTIAVLAGTILGQSARHWRPFKIAYNVGQFVIGITAAEFVYGLFRLTASLHLVTWLAVTVAMLAYLMVNETFIASIISLVEGAPLQVVRLPAGLTFLNAAGNATIGMLAALVWGTGLVGLPLLVAPIVICYVAYRGWIQSKRQEEQAREGERMQTLYEAGRALFGPLDVTFDYQPFLQLVGQMVDAAEVELVTFQEEEVRVHNSGRGLYLSAKLDEGQEGDRAPERFVSTHPGLSTFLAPITEGNDVRGVLSVHRQAELSPAEASLVTALASQVYVQQENERLFHETAEQRSQLADVIGNTSDGIFVVSANRQILSWNPAMERITGFSRNEAVGRPCDEILKLGYDERATVSRGSLLLEPAGAQEGLFITKDSSERWVRYTTNTMPDREANTNAYVVVARDVTAEMEAERMKTDFVATVSHELRTPLTPLKGFLSSLEQGLVEDSPEARNEYYGIMRRQAERLERLINDILDVSRIDAGKLTIELQDIQLSQLLLEQVQEAQQQPLARPVTFVGPDQPVRVRADPFRVGQVVSNLLSNAFKYSPPDSKIEMRLTVADQAVVSVHNEGEGISVADQKRVFDRFYRVESGLTRKTSGVGLGLFIARRLAEAMGGQLLLQQESRPGWTFSFTLPLSPGEPSTLEPEEVDQSLAGARLS